MKPPIITLEKGEDGVYRVPEEQYSNQYNRKSRPRYRNVHEAIIDNGEKLISLLDRVNHAAKFIIELSKMNKPK